jgi:hypothetical protein
MDKQEALQIIQKLADGIDPATGEIFGPESPYQNVQTVRALFMAADAIAHRIKRQKRKERLPDRAGQPWMEQESEELRQAFNIPLKELTRKHQRTRGAICSQLKKLGLIISSQEYRKSQL